MVVFFVVLFAFNLPSNGYGADKAAHCENEQESTLRASALQSSDMAVSDKYLTCFAYGDGAVSVKKHQDALREADACGKAKVSNDAAELRNFVLTWSGSACAPEVAQRLQQIQKLNAFVIYDNTNFTGTVARQGTTDGETPCGNACQADRTKCYGYSYDTEQKVCTLWSSIQSRIPRGSTRSGSFAAVGIAPPPPPPAPPAPPPSAQPQQSNDGQTSNGPMSYLKGADIPGGDYTNFRDVALEQCNAICVQSPDCAAFTYNTAKNVCFLKNTVGNPIIYANAISGIKGGRAATPTFRNIGTTTNVMPDTDLPNNDASADYAMMRGVSLPDCQRMCVSDGKCVAFTYNHQSNACILKSSYGRSITFLGATSGIKQ